MSAWATAVCAKISALFSLQAAVKAVEKILTVTNNAIHISCLENSKVSLIMYQLIECGLFSH